MSDHLVLVTIAGELDPAMRAEFDDFEVRVGRGVTTIHLTGDDPAVLHGLLHRVDALGLQLLDVHRTSPPPT